MAALPVWQAEFGAVLRANRHRVDTSPLSGLVDITCTTMDLDFFLEHKDQFDLLPDAHIDHMLSLPDCKLRDPMYFHLVVRPGRRAIKIPSLPEYRHDVRWPSEQINHVLDLIIQKCPAGSLKKFATFVPKRGCSTEWHVGQPMPFPPFAPPDMQRVLTIIKNQPNLQEILIHEMDVSYREETLRTIGETCHDLRSLHIDCYYPRETCGTRYVVRPLVDGCPLVRRFQGNLTTLDDVSYALQNWKHLVHFNCTTHTYCTPVKDIVEFCEAGGTLPPLFRPQIELDDEELNYSSRIQTLCPDVSSLTIYTDSADLSQFHFRSTKKLDIHLYNSENFPQMEPFLRECGADVVDLQICFGRGFGLDDEVSDVVLDHALDLSMVVQHCPKLKRMHMWGVPISSTCAYVVTPEKVKFLRCIDIRGSPKHSRTPPDDFLLAVACNGVLEHFDVRDLSSRLLERMTEEMRAAAARDQPSPVFPKLTILGARISGQDVITLEQAVSLVSLAPHLLAISLNQLTLGDSVMLQNFTIQHFNHPLTSFM